MSLLQCPFLGIGVELTDERERHIAEHHPDLLPEHRDKIAGTLADPDQIRRSARFRAAKVFSKMYTDLRDGKHVVVVVVGDETPPRRHWVITAYMTRRLAEGEVQWKRA
ncbi:MAG TPA: hypothetical protein VM285_07345 [Polyangia bacterium]|nr:hypothetical protein [Polyangia bacterium]